MNALQQFIQENKMDEMKVMNALQNAGVVSSECWYAAEVAEADCDLAVEHARVMQTRIGNDR